jgi:uncharacterized cupin superfamily protein
VFEPGGAEGDPENQHRGADQWLYVISGSDIAKIGRRTSALRAAEVVTDQQMFTMRG